MSNKGKEAAFPVPTAYANPSSYESFLNIHSTGGLSKREWFAGMALIGNLANSDPQMRPASQEQVAAWSVEMADALLAKLAEAESEPAP